MSMGSSIVFSGEESIMNERAIDDEKCTFMPIGAPAIGASN
jgi:hypothetical protein